MTARAIAPTILIALAAVSCARPHTAAAVITHASRVQTARPTGHAGPGHPPSPLNRAPSSPPLNSGIAGNATEGEEGLSPAGEADPLVSNGLGSPTCKRVLGRELSAQSRRDCETSGFIAAAAPTGNYGIDVHIDTGVLGVSSGGLLSVVQDLFVAPLWMALVWSVHALVVMLEWSFTIDLVDIATAGGLGSALRHAEASLTLPWLPMALAIASVLVAYNGLVRRRVAETLGEALMMGTMMAGGIWLILDPTATVGALGRWASQASLGTLAVTARGTPAAPGQALTQSMDTLFTQAIEAPWCYLEFGEVAWCRDPARLDARLRAAGVKIAADEVAQVGCKNALQGCPAAGTPSAKAIEHSAQLLRGAQSNGAIFLALPANGSARNSINQQGSLLRTLCQSSEATNCRGPTAAQAEFRTNGGTWSRLGGLLLITAGLLGMLLLMGFIAVRLLGAALFSVLYLLLAPGMVIAPAFGEGGRAVFRRWVSRLLGAVVSKLLFSFLLGAVLAVLAILSHLQALGWWTQWLLMSAFWWSAYARRHQVLGVMEGALNGRRSVGEHRERRSAVRRVSDVLESRKGMAASRWATGRISRPAPSVEQRRLPRRSGERHQVADRATASIGEQVTRMLDGEHRDASARFAAAPASHRRLSAKHAQVERIRREGLRAVSAGETRRAAELSHRGDRVASEIDRERDALRKARRIVREGDQALRSTGNRYTGKRLAERARFLDAQAALPPGARDRASLAGLAGYGREEYEQLDPCRERAARLEIDRELALRRELNETTRIHAPSGGSARPGGDEPRSAGDLGHAHKQARHEPLDGSASPRKRAASGVTRQDRRSDRKPASDRSSVLRDAREVAARRKRQLGRDRP